MSTHRKRLGIVGAGIVGLAHALAASKRGYRVTVFERNLAACGASIRNFGMLWPIGQPAGRMHQLALRSRQLWIDIARQAGVWLDPCGSLHLAHRADEWEVLQQFCGLAPNLGFECKLYTPSQVHQATPAAAAKSLLGGMFSPTEMAVDPRMASAQIASWLSSTQGVEFCFGQTVTQVSSHCLSTASGQQHGFDEIVICSGADFETLFPEQCRTAGMRRCKLQMLRTEAQAAGWRIGTHLASGLTLRHYANFEICPALLALKQRIASETPELDRFGIHVMASQNNRNEILLGDSHEYDAEIEPFDKAQVDELMLRELRKVFAVPSWNIVERWHGIYAKSPAGYVALEPCPGVRVYTGLGGAGMTMSFGLADEAWQQWHSPLDSQAGVVA